MPKTPLSIEKRAHITTLSNLKFSVRQIAKKTKVCETSVHDAVMKYQNEDISRTERRLADQGFPASEKLCYRNYTMSSSQKRQTKLMEIGTVVSAKTIQRRLSLEFVLTSCKSARKQRLTQAMKKKRLDFAKGHSDVEKSTSLRRVSYTTVFYSKISCLEVCWSTLRGKVHYPNCETPPSQIIWGTKSSGGELDFIFCHRNPP